MRALIVLTAMTAAVPVEAQENHQDTVPTIMVTGSPLAETGRKLKDCLARRCTPKEDIAASLAHAENQYLAGDYEGARATLSRSHNRNARYAKTYPVEVSDLQRAYGSVTDIAGLPENGRVLQIFAFETLRAGQGGTSESALDQLLLTGDASLTTGRLTRAMDVYRKVERKARESGQLQVQGRAMLRQAGTYTTLATRAAGYDDLARRQIERIEQTSAPELATYRIAAGILRARLAASKGGEASIDKAIATLPAKGKARLVPFYDPPLLPADPGIGVAPPSDPEWIDLRYRVDASGRVHDVEQLRGSAHLTGDWARHVRTSVARRRYVPMDFGTDGDDLVRIERFTLVFDAFAGTGTHISGRADAARIVALDLTPGAGEKSASR
ncbi:MAG: hypothetical protein IIZ38_21355 [Sphingomonas sp.]|uniref:hypothetical protein n=1 Tax=Sphingomonas sp. TaxID=28214 RepID=UPI0025DBD644|nr:hypothetical protein [Sphingomonas sp.]MBQ1500867.1 hypothetical protein [Sphingomonas sp.]